MPRPKVGVGIYFATRASLWAELYGTKGMDEILEFAESAENSGYDSIWVGDSIIAKPRYDSLMALSAIAARTHRVKLGTCCFGSFPLREPISLAHTWASLDQFSKGRTILGVCMGGGGSQLGGSFEDEYRIFGIPVKARASVLEEKMQLLRKLWSGKKVNFEGKHFHYENVQLVVRPFQNEPPIWIASNPFSYTTDEQKIERGFRRVVELADGWLTICASQTFKKNWEKIRQLAMAVGRGPDTLGNRVFHGIILDEDQERGYATAKAFLDRYYGGDLPKALVDRWVTYGSPDHCIKSLQGFVDNGVQNFVIRFPCLTVRDQFSRFTKEIIPSFVTS